MTTLVWLFFLLACFASAYITYRTTKWYCNRKCRKIQEEAVRIIVSKKQEIQRLNEQIEELSKPK